MRVPIFLNCLGCLTKDKIKRRNYRTDKAKDPQKNTKIELQKYCKFCQKSQPHKEELIKK